MIGSTVVATVPATATVPTGCGVVGAAGVTAMSFPDPAPGGSIAAGSVVTFENVGTANGQIIDATATVESLVGGTITFESPNSATVGDATNGFANAGDASILLGRSASTMSARVRWSFFADETPGQPVPVLSSWLIRDIDGPSRESLSIAKAGLTALAVASPTNLTTAFGTDPVTVVGTQNETGGNTSKVQLDLAGVSQVVVTYGLGSGSTAARYIHNASGTDPITGSITCTGVSDFDNDGTSDIADVDDDNDGIPDVAEGDDDPDADGKPNYKDIDADNDGIPDTYETAADFDGDGEANHLDLDADGDGLDDVDEAGHGLVGTGGRLTGPVGLNGLVDLIEVSGLTFDTTNSSIAYTVKNADGGTDDFLERADVGVTVLTSLSLVPGTTGDVTLGITNNGIGDAGDLVVRVPLAAGLSLDPSSPASCVESAGAVECSFVGPIPDGATPSVTFTLAAAPSMAAAAIPTTATIVQRSTPDADAGNDFSSATITILPAQANIAAVSLTNASTVPGGAASTSLVVTNDGPSDSAAFTVNLPLPADTTFVSGTSSAACSFAAGSVTCSVAGPLAPGASRSFTVGLAVDPAAPAGASPLVATVVPTTGGDSTADNSTSATLTVGTPVADVEVTSTTPTIDPGDTGTMVFTVVHEGGSSAAPNAHLVVTLPPDVTVDPGVALPGGCTTNPAGTVVDCSLGTLAVGSSTDVSIGVAVAAAAPASVLLPGTAVVSTGATDSDGASSPANVRTGAAEADLDVTITSVPTLTPGTSGDVGVEVTNHGPSDSGVVTVTYSTGTGVTIDTSSPSWDSANCSVDVSLTVATCTVAALADDATHSLVIPIVLDAAVTTTPTGGSITATSAGTTDPAPADDSAPANPGVSAPVADLAVAVGSVPTLTIADPGTLAITVTNTGPSAAGTARVDLAFPADVAFDPAGANPSGCSPTVGGVSCPLAAGLAPGGTRSISFPIRLVSAASTATTIPFGVSVTDQSVTDPALGNDTTSGSLPVDTASDTDGDGIPDTVEIGPDPLNPVDTDGDGTPDHLETDSDADGIPDTVEAGTDPSDPLDVDGDGTPDYRDTDSDADGMPDTLEAGADPSNPVDTDGDGTPDHRDLDSDGDDIADVIEAGGSTPRDSDGDGTPDPLDLDSDGDGITDRVEGAGSPLSPLDTDGDGTPDYRELDSDGDGIADAVERGATPLAPSDTDEDGIPDYRDLDSDDDGFTDAAEVAAGGTADDDRDGVPNWQDPDVTAVSGRLTDVRGAPLAGVTVVIVDAAGHRHTTRTDANGDYSLVAGPSLLIEPGMATITAIAADGTVVGSGVISVQAGIESVRNLQAPAQTQPTTSTTAPRSTTTARPTSNPTSSDPGMLAFTGTNAAVLASVGAALVLLGSMTLGVGRRRRAAD